MTPCPCDAPSGCVLNEGRPATIQTKTSMNGGRPIGFCALHFNAWCDFLAGKKKLGLYTELDYQEFRQERIKREADWGIGARN